MHTSQTLSRRLAARLSPTRLVRCIKAYALRARRQDLQQQLDVLTEHMAIDAVLAQQQRATFLRSPELMTRMYSDSILQRDLRARIGAIDGALRTLGLKP